MIFYLDFFLSLFVVTNLFPEKIPIIWSKKSNRRTDDGIESITNCLYVKCKESEKYYNIEKKFHELKRRMVYYCGSLFSSDMILLFFMLEEKRVFFSGRWKDAEKLHF